MSFSVTSVEGRIALGVLCAIVAFLAIWGRGIWRQPSRAVKVAHVLQLLSILAWALPMFAQTRPSRMAGLGCVIALMCATGVVNTVWVVGRYKSEKTASEAVEAIHDKNN